MARVRAQALRLRIAEIDALDHRAFEFDIRDLMRRDGDRGSAVGVGVLQQGIKAMSGGPIGPRLR